METVITECREYNSADLWYSCKSMLNGVDAQLVTSCSGMRFYIDFLWCPLDESNSHPRISFDIEVCEVHETLYGTLLNGGQRVMLEEASARSLIQHLLEGETVILRKDIYCVTLSPKYFEKNYCELHKLIESGKLTFQGTSL